MHVVHCGVEPDRYAPDPARAPGKRLLFVGRLAAVKGLPVLFEAVAALRARHPDLALDLVGDGAERPALEALATRLGIAEATRFLGYRSQDEVAARLAETDLFVLPSFAEGVPVVLMEALAARVPVVATRVAGVGELVEDGASGLTVPPGDATALAEAIDRLLADPALRARMGEAGRARVVADFDATREARRLLALLRAAMTGGPRPPLRPDPEPPAPAPPPG
jgi:glycosyltransferase involved in cell wall biosynthesis